MREDQDAKLRQILVAADMVDVDMRIDEKADIAIGDLSDSRHDLVGERREQGSSTPSEPANTPMLAMPSGRWIMWT